MFKLSFVLAFLLISTVACRPQIDVSNYYGEWEGEFSNPKSFQFMVTIEHLGESQYQLTIESPIAKIQRTLASTSKNGLRLMVDEYMWLDLYYQDGQSVLAGMLHSGALIYSIHLQKNDQRHFVGSWHPLMIDTLENQYIYFDIGNYEGSEIAAYPIFGDQRFSGTWATGFTHEDGAFYFRDFKTGLQFKGKLLGESIQMDMLFASEVVASTRLSRSTSNWVLGVENAKRYRVTDVPANLNDGWAIGNIQEQGIREVPLAEMLNSIYANRFENTHSILIAKQGKLAFEAYFNGHHAHIPHDMRSASKSIASAMIGIAIDDNIIGGTQQKLYDCIPAAYQYTKDSLKAAITLFDLLTMSSGLDVKGGASEGSYQNSDNWLQTTLEASMAATPGTQTLYGSANPYLLGVCLHESLEGSLEMYMYRKLFAPLGITNYIVQTENTRTAPYFGGGAHLTSRDMLKFGQLYLNGGTWNGQRILAQSWVAQSMMKHAQLENAKDKNEYGFQWWHKTYQVGGKAIASIEARGSGGQYIFILPALESVVVITSGNFRNNSLLQQPEKIVEDFVLPAIVD